MSGAGTAVGTTSGTPFGRAWGLLQAGKLETAEKAFRDLLHDDPGSSEVWRGIGLVAYRSDRYRDAERALRKAIAFNPNNVLAKHHLAVTLRALKDLDGALKVFAEIAGKFGDDPSFLNNWGNALVAAGRAGEGADILERAVAINPKSDFLRCNFAKALMGCERFAKAIEVLRSAPGDADRVELAGDLGNALLAAGHHAEATRQLRRARDAGLATAGDLHNLGTALQFLGNMEEARKVYREAIARDPEAAMSRRQLAGIVTFTGSEQLSELRAALDQPDLSLTDRAEAYLGLAKAFDDIGDHAQAFSYLQAGNQLLRTAIGYSADANAAFTDRSIETFTRSFLEDRRDWGNPTTRPIFILGMPRSGTTLLEQILCTHSEVHGAGELLNIFLIFQDLRQAITPDLGTPRIASQITEELTRKSTKTYLDHIDGINGQARYVSDKMPFNFRYLGFISLLFPNAKIIHTVRHPLDTGLSCYFARFREALDFSFNLSDIGRYYRDYERLMDHWMGAIGNDLLTVDYDTLVANQERETRRILEFCGLAWDPRCLAFHLTERPVLTASNWQVRQPLYSTSSGRWRKYRQWLGPMMASLGLHDPDAWSPRERRTIPVRQERAKAER